MSNIKRLIKLSQQERKTLTEFTSKGTHPSRIIRRAQIILALDSSYNRTPDKEADIANRLSISKQAVHNAKNDFIELGIENFLQRRKRDSSPVPVKADGKFEAYLIALCCSDPPKGYDRWTVRLLADKVVELGYLDSVSHMTVSRALKKTNLSLT
jgi:hypothetical protein